MSETRVYFTWPDATLTYDCAPCGACCRGLGIGLDATAGQLQRLASLYPGVAPFARLRGATWTLFNPRDRCWFLADDGLCTVERDHGRDTKPASCRLFPFNRVFRLGEVLVVDYNAVVCPLTLAAGGAGIRHAEVLADLDGVRDPGVVGVPLPVADSEAASRFADREQGVAEACFRLASGGVDTMRAGLSAVIAATERPEGGPCGLGDGIAAVLDAGASLPDDTTLRHALVAWPSLRFNELYGRRRYPSEVALVAALPAMATVWLRLLAAGNAAAGLALSLQEVTSVWGEVAPLCWLVSQWDARVALSAGPIDLPADEPWRGRALDLARSCVDNASAWRPLGELLGPALVGLPVAERVAVLRPLAELGDRWLDAGRARAASPSTAARRKKRR